jgi:hypothetical protein
MNTGFVLLVVVLLIAKLSVSNYLATKTTTLARLRAKDNYDESPNPLQYAVGLVG